MSVSVEHWVREWVAEIHPEWIEAVEAMQRERDELLRKLEGALRQREDLLKAHEDALRQREDLLKEREHLLKEREDLQKENEEIKSTCNRPICKVAFTGIKEERAAGASEEETIRKIMLEAETSEEMVRHFLDEYTDGIKD